MLITESKKTKLYLITQHYPYGSGEKTFIEPELKYLIESQKFDITIISNAVEGSESTSTVDSGIKVIRIPLTSAYKKIFSCFKYGIRYLFDKKCKEERNQIRTEKEKKLGKLIESIFFFVQANIFFSQLKKEDIALDNSLIYTYWFYTQTLAIALNKDKFQNAKLISRIHRFDLYEHCSRYGRQPFAKLNQKKTDKIFFIAEEGMKYYAGIHGEQNQNKYALCRLGTICIIQYGEIRQKQRKCQKFLLVSCSNLIPVKRVQCIVEALEKINDIEIEWIHFGDGIERKRIEETAFKRLKNKKNINYTFRGQTDNKEICEFYLNNAVDCFITTSTSEGCPVSIQEALSYGMPVIATAVGEIPFMIKGNGILLNQYPTSAEVAEAIRIMYSTSEEEREEMKQTSRALWEKHFNAEKNYRVFVNELIRMTEE